MNQYVTGAVIKELREKYHFTQTELAKKTECFSQCDAFEIICVPLPWSTTDQAAIADK